MEVIRIRNSFNSTYNKINFGSVDKLISFDHATKSITEISWPYNARERGK